MSYSYELAADARPDFQELDVQAQEQVLDLIEAYAERLPEVDVALEDVLEVESRRGPHLVFIDIRVLCDPLRKMVSIVEIQRFQTLPFI